MAHNRFLAVVVALSPLLALNTAATGAEIYRWVDKDGVVHFSEHAPSPGVAGVSKLIVTDTTAPDYDPHDDESSISSQAERMNLRWTEIKARRDERREQRSEEAERAALLALAAREPEDYYTPPVWYAPVYSGGLGHRHRSKVMFHRKDALDRFGLADDSRPYSINSSAHFARITASREALRGPRPKRGTRHRGPSIPRKDK